MPVRKKEAERYWAGNTGRGNAGAARRSTAWFHARKIALNNNNSKNDDAERDLRHCGNDSPMHRPIINILTLQERGRRELPVVLFSSLCIYKWKREGES